MLDQPTWLRVCLLTPSAHRARPIGQGRGDDTRRQNGCRFHGINGHDHSGVRSVARIVDLGSVEIRPGVGTLGMFKFMDYTPWYAIGEFVDNSVASWQQKAGELRKADGPEYTLEIHISFDPSDTGELRVWDNAAGISAADYPRAFKPAERPPDQTTLARYGMGMKTAACWFSDHWKVTSTALGESVERTVEFDIPALMRSGVERISPVSRKANLTDHWTELVLWDLSQLPVGRTVGKIKDYLSQMYRRFISEGHVQIYWNDEPLRYKERKVLVAPSHSSGDTGKPRRWEKPIDFTLPKGERVQGRAVLFETGEQAAAGLHLFWRGRMIKGNLENFYRPLEIFSFAGSYRVQRLLVELDMDSFTPTVDKKDFIWSRDGSTEQQLLAELRKQLNKQPLPMLDQADNYRSTKLDKAARAAATKAAEATAEAVEQHGEAIAGQAERGSSGSDKLPPPRGPIAGETTLEISVGDVLWKVAIQFSDRPEDRSQWLEITEKPRPTTGSRKLGIKISLSHPFTTRFATDSRSMALLVRLAAGIAMAELAAREAGGNNVGAVRRNLNEILLNVLSES